MRQCTKCKKFKEFSEFDKDKNDYQLWCKSCRKKDYQDNKPKILKQKAKYYQEHKLERTKYGIKYYQEHKVERAKYRQEHKTEIAKYRQEHKSEIAEYQAKYDQEHKPERAKYRREHKVEKAEYQRKYAQEHKLEIAKYDAKYRKNNPDKINAKSAKRRALKLNQIPLGTDLKEVAKFYELAQMLSIVLSVKMQVDHYIPLSKGGLHCPENLRIIPASENLAKGNKLPSEFYK